MIWLTGGEKKESYCIEQLDLIAKHQVGYVGGTWGSRYNGNNSNEYFPTE